MQENILSVNPGSPGGTFPIHMITVVTDYHRGACHGGGVHGLAAAPHKSSSSVFAAATASPHQSVAWWQGQAGWWWFTHSQGDKQVRNGMRVTDTAGAL